MLVLSALGVAAMGFVAVQPSWGQNEGTAGFLEEPVTVPAALPPAPGDFEVDASEAINIANEQPEIEEIRDERGGIDAVPEVKIGRRWDIHYADDGEQVALVEVDAATGDVLETWTGEQVIWPMARGYEGQFGHILNAPYVWIPLSAIFFFALVDLRRLGRIAHLDLLVLLGFGISHIFYNDANIGVSAPLTYPPLIYLLARMLWIGFRGRGAGLRPSVPIAWLAVATVFLIGFRVAVNIADSGVIDVGYAGVIGAERIADGDPLYGEDAFPPENPTGDTYGPVNYLAYVPFEAALPWSGAWDDLPSAHAAAIFFDLATIIGLVLLGRRLQPGKAGRDLGVVLAFAWTAYPYTDFVLQSNSNDSLVAALLVWALVLFSSLAGRALLLALAAAAKFTPLVLVPLFATGEEGLSGKLRVRRLPRRMRLGLARFEPLFDTGEQGAPSKLSVRRLPRRTWLRLAYFGSVFAAITALILVYPAVDPGLAIAWDRTIGSQLERESPFSIWGQVPALQPLQSALMVAAIGLAASLALVPARRSLVQVAALSAAVLIAVQLTLEHWFYPYIPWFFGLVLAAIAPRPVGEPVSPERPSRQRPDAPAERESREHPTAPAPAGGGPQMHDRQRRPPEQPTSQSG